MNNESVQFFDTTLAEFGAFVRAKTGRDYPVRDLMSALAPVALEKSLSAEEQKQLHAIAQRIIAKRQQKAGFAQKVELAKAYLTARKELGLSLNDDSPPAPPSVVRVHIQPVVEAIDRQTEAINRAAEAKQSRKITVTHDDGTTSTVSQE